ncbi:hypothetical protein ABEV36_08640 [Heyndrickxia faecalis]
MGDFATEAHWARNETYKSLDVPLGLRGREILDICSAELVEERVARMAMN